MIMPQLPETPAALAGILPRSALNDMLDFGLRSLDDAEEGGADVTSARLLWTAAAKLYDWKRSSDAGHQGMAHLRESLSLLRIAAAEKDGKAPKPVLAALRTYLDSLKSLDPIHDAQAFISHEFAHVVVVGVVTGLEPGHGKPVDMMEASEGAIGVEAFRKVAAAEKRLEELMRDTRQRERIERVLAEFEPSRDEIKASGVLEAIACGAPWQDRFLAAMHDGHPPGTLPLRLMDLFKRFKVDVRIRRQALDVLTELPDEWQPRTEANWNAFSELVSTMGPLLETSPYAREVLFSGCEGRWSTYLQMLAIEGGMKVPYRFGDAARAVEAGKAFTKAVSDIHLAPLVSARSKGPKHKLTEIRDAAHSLVTMEHGLRGLARLGVSHRRFDACVRTIMEMGGHGPVEPFVRILDAGTVAPGLRAEPCRDIVSLLDESWVIPGAEWSAKAVDCLLGTRVLVDLVVERESRLFPVARLSLAWSAPRDDAEREAISSGRLAAPDVVACAPRTIRHLPTPSWECLILQETTAARGVDVNMVDRARDAFVSAMRAGRIPVLSRDGAFPLREDDVFAAGRWPFPTPSQESTVRVWGDQSWLAWPNVSLQLRMVDEYVEAIAYVRAGYRESAMEAELSGIRPILTGNGSDSDLGDLDFGAEFGE